MTPDEIKDLTRWGEQSGGIADGRPFLADRRLDAIIEVMLEMAAQLWVSRRREAVLEAVLADKGLIASEDVEQHCLSPDAHAAMRQQRAEFVSTLFRSLSELPADPAA